MTTSTSPETIEKLTRVWSSRRACEILVRLTYSVRTQRGCKIYQLSSTEELT